MASRGIEKLCWETLHAININTKKHVNSSGLLLFNVFHILSESLSTVDSFECPKLEARERERKKEAFKIINISEKDHSNSIWTTLYLLTLWFLVHQTSTTDFWTDSLFLDNVEIFAFHKRDVACCPGPESTRLDKKNIQSNVFAIHFMLLRWSRRHLKILNHFIKRRNFLFGVLWSFSDRSERWKENNSTYIKEGLSTNNITYRFWDLH